MMKKIVTLLTGLLLLSACRSVSYDDLNPTIQPNDNLLPVLSIIADTSAYPKTLYGAKTDAKNIFIKEVQENIIEQTGAKKGYIKMRISYVESEHNPLYRLSEILLYIPALLGVPFGNSEYTTEVEVTIQDNNKNVIKRYVERATDTEYAAFYWGYDNFDVNNPERKAAAMSLKQALENVRYQINNDAPQIRAELK